MKKQEKKEEFASFFSLLLNSFFLVYRCRLEGESEREKTMRKRIEKKRTSFSGRETRSAALLFQKGELEIFLYYLFLLDLALRETEREDRRRRRLRRSLHRCCWRRRRKKRRRERKTSTAMPWTSFSLFSRLLRLNSSIHPSLYLSICLSYASSNKISHFPSSSSLVHSFLFFSWGRKRESRRTELYLSQ